MRVPSRSIIRVYGLHGLVGRKKRGGIVSVVQLKYCSSLNTVIISKCSYFSVFVRSCIKDEDNSANASLYLNL